MFGCALAYGIVTKKLQSFWSYELSKRLLMPDVKTGTQEAARVLLCGGIAGVISWTPIYPLDVIKTRVQTRLVHNMVDEQGPLMSRLDSVMLANHGALQTAKDAFREEGFRVFFKGLGVCGLRAFVVNAVQVPCRFCSPCSQQVLILTVGGLRMDNKGYKGAIKKL